MDMFSTSVAEFSDHWPYKAIKHWKCGQCDRSTNILLYLYLNLISHVRLVTSILLGSAAFRVRQVFISFYWQEGMGGKSLGSLGSFRSDSGSKLSTRVEEGEWGSGGLSQTQESLCVFTEDSQIPLALIPSPFFAD